MNGEMDILRNRMSLRKYAKRPISKEDLNLILEDAMRAPTAGNMMMYSILVIEDDARKEKLSITCDNQPFIAKAPVILIFLADMQRLFDFYGVSKVKEFCSNSNLEFEGPDEGDLMLAVEDAVIAAQNAVIAAESLGIGSCYIGDIMENYEVHKEMFNLPEWVFPISLLTMGYYSEDYKRIISPRFDKKFIVFNESYRRLTEEEFSEMYADREKKLSKQNAFKAENFGQMLYARKTGSNFAKEMRRSVKVMLENWKGKKL